MNSVEELSTTTHIQRLPVNTFKTAATTYDFPEHPPKKEKKWSFGNLFRRKKKEETDSSSDEELQKKQPANSKKKRKQDRRKKLGTFDHIVVNNGYSRYEDVGVLSDPSGGNYAGRPLPKIPSEDKERQGSFESVRRSYRARAAARRGGKDGSSSDEDSQRSFSSSSLNNRRDGSLSRRSRVARTERYIRRLSKDDETILNREALQRQTKENWDLNIKPTENLSGLFTIPPSHNYNRYHQQQRGFNTANPNHQEANSAEVFHESSPKTNCFNVRSLSCDSNIHKSPSPEVMHVQFPIGRVRKVIEPPPPPPRDPRRVAAVPSSHCFDKILQRNNYKPNSNWHAGYRTASEDHIPTEPRQPLAPRPASVTNENRQPRYIKRHVQESADRFQYLTEKKPRSRKPIFIQSTDKINTANFTKTTNHANPIDITRTGNPNTSFHKSTPPKFIPGHTNGIPSSPNPKETYSTSFNSNSSLYSNSPSFNHASPSSLNRNHSQKLPDHTYSNTRGGSFNRTTPKQDFTDFKRTDSQNSINFWKRKEIENSPSSKSTSSSPQMFTAQTHVQTKIFLPSVIQEPESTDTVDFIQRNASPFKPISSPSLADRKNEITSSVDSLSNEFKSEDVKRKSANLEEALDELEAIYKSLHLGDEDLLERAEQREMSIAAQKMMESNMEMYPGSRGALSDSSFSYEPYHSLDNPRKKKLKKSQTLDRKNDDMAYRKMNKDRAHTIGNPQSVIASVSYLLASPVHCPADNESIVDPDDEPDITLDDVVYRSIKHANNSLKVADPQPPFGIPIGPIAPAPNSDYLHAVPENTIEFTFKHKKIPDVVKDDLAFRNLRKDSNKEHKLPNDEPSHEQVFRNLNKSSIRSPRRNTQECTYHQNNSPMKNLEEEANANKKRRAVRSLSANISNIMNQEYSEFNQSSLTDIADAMEIARQILKEKENKITSTKRAFLSDSETKYRKPYVQSASSTETITESRLNFLNEMRNKDLHLLNEDYLHAKPPRGSSPARRQSKESTPVPTSAEEKEKITSFEDMLTALAVEARETSDRITKELMDDDLNLNNKLKGDKKEEDKSDVKMVTNNVSKVHAYEDVHSSILDFNKEMKMLDENLRKHEQALSSRLSKNSDVKIIGQAESMLSKNTDARISGKAIEGAFSLEQDEKPEERGSKSNVDVKPEEKSPSPYPRSLLKSKVHTEVGSSSAHRGDNLRKLEEPVRNLVIGEENLSEAQKKTDGNQDIDKYLTVDDHDFQKLVDNMKNPEPLKSADDSEHEINFNTELEMLDRNLNNTQSKNDLDSRLSEIDAVSEHAKMCEKLFECVVESTELIAATKTESNPVEEVENIETLIPESVANIVTTRNVEEVKDALNFEIHSNSEEEGDYENLGSDSELGKSSKSPFEEHKAELIATFKKLDKFSEDLECRLSAPLAEDEIESCDEEILNTVNEYKTTKETNDVKDGESSSSKYEDPDGKSSSSKYEDYGANSSSSKYEDLDGKSSSEINTKPSDAEAKGGEECVLATALPERAFVCKTTINIPATYTTNCDIYVSDSHSESGFHSNSSCTDSTSCAESNVEHLSDTVDQIPSLLLESLKSPMLVKETSRRLSTAKEDKKDGSALRPSCSSGRRNRRRAKRNSSRNTSCGNSCRSNSSDMSETQETNSQQQDEKKKKQESKTDRMARYKEERRRQLAAQFNETTHRLTSKDGSSSASEGPRMTRTARLRAAANSSPSTPGKEPRSSPASSLASYADLPRRLEKEKDKSSKRKSNLNRSLTSEEVAIDINDDSKTRRRRRRFFPPEVLQQSLNTSSNEDKQRSDASLTANNTSPLSSPITAAAIATVKTTPRRSELSVHMENARRGVTAPFSSIGKNSNRSSPKRISPRLENKENFKRKTDEGINGNQRTDKNKVPNVNNNDSEQKITRSSRSSRRLDELAALTRDTLAHVERIAAKQSKLNGSEEKNDVKNLEATTPVSILKRKVSQDESKSMVNINTPPVTFSPNVIEPTPTKRKQGILKKRRSLDESQVLRHRSCSPDMACKSDSKSILKNQRRSSLEEIMHLATTDSNLPSILKRKTSRCEDENLDNSLNSPQGILKRRSGASSAGSTTSTHHHVSITTAVILAAAEGAEMILDNSETTMRPILKKKSISDDGENDSLKPILKKKSSTDTDDGEERPKRPILKLTRSCDSKDSDFSKYSANESGSECEVRPILKTSSKDESPRPRLSFCADDDVSLQNGEEEHYQRRRSKRLNQSDFLTVNNGSTNGTREMDRDVTRPRIVSVSELVMSFEKSTGAIPKKSSFKRNSDRCRTQPITINEFEASLSYMKSPQLEDFPRLAQSSPSSNSHSSHSLLDLATTLGNAERLNTYFSNSLPIANADCGGKMSSDSAFQSLGDGLELEQEEKEKDTKSITSKVNAGIQRYKNKSIGADRASYSRYPTQPITLDEVQEAARINIDANSNNEQSAEPESNEPDPSKLSFSERIKLFAKKTVEVEKPQTLDMDKRRLRRVTQPITANEVETALFLNHNNNKNEKPPTLSPCALGNETFADRRGILKSKLDFSAVTVRRKQQHREKSRSPPPPMRNYSPSLGLKDPVDFTYDEGISSNDSGSDSDVKIVVNSEKGVCAKKPSRYINGSDHTSDESSGGREIQSIIGKEAVAKRRQMRERLSSDGYITKSRSQANVGDDIGQRPSSNSAAMPRATIGELQAKLQQSGDNEWRKRLPKLNNASEELNLLNVKNLYNDTLSEKGSILEAKKDELDASARQWKNRVEKSDANEFSVAGRMQIKDIPSVPINIPTVDKVRRIPKAKRFKGKGGDDGKDTSSTPVSPDIDESLGFKRSISVPTNSTDDSSGSESSLRSSGRKVAVFRPDDDTFKSFFKSVDVVKSEERVEVSLDAFDCVTRETESLLVNKKNIKVQRRKATSRNPVKALAARSDIQNEYTEIITGVAERETKRLNIEKLTKNSNLAVEALAGLASKEDFASVALKKSSAPNISYLPFTNLMLLQVKGRRHVQTRLVEPVAASVNKGDNYILITPSALYHYIGAYSNVIEQSRAADIINHIQQSGDMGCKIEKAISINTKKSLFSKDFDKFLALLGAEPEVEIAGAGHPDEDEVYESTMVDTNMIYCVENKELVPLEDYWGKIPKIEILTPSRVLVFDFGSEMYVWSGKNADPEEKKVALKLAKELWDNGYNYSECAVCPLTVAKMIGERAKVSDNMKSESRPEWALFAKITQHRETILFREKFLDWPDYSRVIKVKNNDQEKSTETSFDIKPCDASKLLKFEYTEPDLEVEGSHLGRGKCFYDAETNRNFEINTLDVTCWVTLENTYEELGSECFGHFYDGESYIVRWRFRVTVTGRELSGKPSKHAQLGRDRCVYFCWLGKNASINEKGAAALLTVELDSEQAKQIRVTQGSEPPAFLQLFDGKMFIHSGKRDSEKAPTRLYISRGEMEHETVLIEVPCSMRSLRSRTSFVFVETNKITVWHGSKSLNQTRTVTKDFADNIRADIPSDFDFTPSGQIELCVVEEGDEKATFLCELEKRQLYNSLVKDNESYEDMPRMFYFESVSSGVFEAMEILCPHRSMYPTPYPFLQNELYSANQPALFLIDNGHELWLWQGWWPDRENDDLELSEQTGSGAMRWQAERRAAMQTAIDYWHSKNPDAKSVPAYLVWAGLEPLAFTNLFPVWCDRDDIAELNIKEGKKAGDMVLIEKELALLTRTTYPLAELLQRPLPDGVDPTHLEKYLSPDDFTDLLSMTLEEFNKLPSWKQTALKKEHGLF